MTQQVLRKTLTTGSYIPFEFPDLNNVCTSVLVKNFTPGDILVGVGAEPASDSKATLIKSNMAQICGLSWTQAHSFKGVYVKAASAGDVEVQASI